MKYFLSTVIGLITGIVGISIFEYISVYAFPLPAEIDTQDINSITENMNNIPLINLILVIASYGLASLIAGFVSVKIKTGNSIIPILNIGILLTIFGFINFITIPHPIWMILVGSVTFIPMTWLGGKLGMTNKSNPSEYIF